MNIAVLLKNNLKEISPGIGQVINKIPYSNRPGLAKIYKKRKKEIKEVEALDYKGKQIFVFSRIKKLVETAFETIPFYKEHYNANGFQPSQLQNFDDIKKIPIINKTLLQEWDIKLRSAPRKGSYIVNTGGSTGTPFGFYIEPSSMGHEWAHMHTIWEKFEYSPSKLKLTFGGRGDIKNFVEYDVVRNQFSLDIYSNYALVASKLKELLSKYEVSYLHGYPSSIYDFALYCEQEDPELRKLLSKTLRGAFLGSEFPHQIYREKIEKVFGIPTISWYGHTERAVLAYEKSEKFRYEPFLSYGFSEAIPLENGDYNLIATSYYNYASPLIRYNTEDVISQIEVKEGILESYRITKGREGEFVIDKSGKKINLTGLIFGRHHELFNFSKFIQVKQISEGMIQIHFVSEYKTEEEAVKLFDTKNLDFDISFVRNEEPIRTKSGKINILIK